MVHNHKGAPAVMGAHQVVAQIQVLHWEACLMQHTPSISRQQMLVNADGLCHKCLQKLEKLRRQCPMMPHIPIAVSVINRTDGTRLLVQVVLLTCLKVSALSSLVYMVTAPRSSAPVGTVRLVPSGATGHAEGIARNTCRQPCTALTIQSLLLKRHCMPPMLYRL